MDKRHTTTDRPVVAADPIPAGRWLPWALLLPVALAGLAVTAATMGYIRIPFGEVVRIILAGVGAHPQGAAAVKPLWAIVVMDVRLPRILCAALAGGGLAMSGAVYQGILLNPLADPYTLGVSAGAAFGAAIALLLNLTATTLLSVPAFAFAGAVATLFLVIFLSSSAGGFSHNNLILAGIIVASILSAGISFLKFIADEQVSVIIFWLMGSFAARTWADVVLLGGVVALGAAVFIFFSRDLNLMALGKRSAQSLGVDTGKVRLILLICASLVAAICVAVAGIIGFVGLLVPHIVRMVSGPDNRGLIPLSLFLGAILLLAADTVTRAVLPYEVPIGVITALAGGPLFCYIFWKRQRSGGM